MKGRENRNDNRFKNGRMDSLMNYINKCKKGWKDRKG